METLKFKTNIKCGGCIAAVTPHLKQLPAIENWEVDMQDPDKVLTINSRSSIDGKEIVKVLAGAGYEARELL